MTLQYHRLHYLLEECVFEHCVSEISEAVADKRGTPQKSISEISVRTLKKTISIIHIYVHKYINTE